VVITIAAVSPTTSIQHEERRIEAIVEAIHEIIIIEY
jgi:hypothetical protein